MQSLLKSPFLRVWPIDKESDRYERNNNNAAAIDAESLSLCLSFEDMSLRRTQFAFVEPISQNTIRHSTSCSL